MRNTQSRTLAPGAAAGRVAEAFVDVPSGWSGIVLKKIDTGLRGQLGSEIDAAMDALALDEAFVLAAIPEVGRTTVDGRQLIAGVPVHETAFARDPQNPIRESSVGAVLEDTGRRRAGLLPLAAARAPERLADAIDAERARGAAVIVCDAETDADLEQIVRVLLRRRRPLLLVGSIGLARALRRVLGPEAGTRGRPPAAPPSSGTGVLVVVGSAHPTARVQVERAVERRLLEVVVVEGPAAAEDAGREAVAVLRAGKAVALVPPVAPASAGSAEVLLALRTAALASMGRVQPAGLALVGGETAFEVLNGLGNPPLLLEVRLSPLVVRSRLLSGAYGGMTVVTKGGSTGAPDLLGAIVRQLGRGGG